MLCKKLDGTPWYFMRERKLRSTVHNHSRPNSRLISMAWNSLTLCVLQSEQTCFGGLQTQLQRCQTEQRFSLLRMKKNLKLAYECVTSFECLSKSTYTQEPTPQDAPNTTLLYKKSFIVRVLHKHVVLFGHWLDFVCDCDFFINVALVCAFVTWIKDYLLTYLLTCSRFLTDWQTTDTAEACLNVVSWTPCSDLLPACHRALWVVFVHALLLFFNPR